MCASYSAHCTLTGRSRRVEMNVHVQQTRNIQREYIDPFQPRWDAHNMRAMGFVRVHRLWKQTHAEICDKRVYHVTARPAHAWSLSHHTWEHMDRHHGNGRSCLQRHKSTLCVHRRIQMYAPNSVLAGPLCVRDITIRAPTYLLSNHG